MDKYIQFVISIDNKYQEALIAELEEMQFDGYQQFEEEITAYIAKKNMHIGDRQRIERILATYPGQNFIQTEKTVEETNWNEQWEETIQPQEIGQFFVKPTWSQQTPDEGQTVLEIDPKMAFGTGYHATTKLMLKMMPQYIRSNTNVLDAGTGTGILAIAAAKLGANPVTAFDTDEWSVQNAKTNGLLNDVQDKIEIRKGSIETIKPSEEFDLILANINKNTIVNMFPSFHESLNKDGILLLSGILSDDRNDIKNELIQNELFFLENKSEEDWTAVAVQKNI